MAQMHPKDGPTQGTTSSAEKRLFDAFKKLPQEYIIIHSVNVAAFYDNGRMEPSEVDFFIIHPQRGILLLEVKGGRITLHEQSNALYSTNREGQTFAINPFKQVLDNERRIWGKLQDIPGFKRKWLFSAVAFPDMIWKSQRPIAFDDKLILDKASTIDLTTSIERLFDARRLEWQPSKLNTLLIDEILNRLFPSLQPPRPGDEIRHIDLMMKKLTQEQCHIFTTIIERQPQCIIQGGAGTGKSFLALTLAAQLSHQGKRVLLLCWSDYQAEWFRNLVAEDRVNQDILQVFPLTTFCGAMVSKAGIVARTLNEDLIEATEGQSRLVRMLEFSIKRLQERRVTTDDDWQYDAIIIDEGQDIEASLINTARLLLRDPKKGYFCVLGDPYQRIDFDSTWNMNPPLPLLPLTRNLRNAPKIQELMAVFQPLLRFYMVDNGYDVGCVALSSLPKNQEGDINYATQIKLRALLQDLLKKGGVDPADILIITGRPENVSQWKSWRQNFPDVPIEHLTNLKTKKQEERAKYVKFSTIRAAKGLESAVVILVELDGIDSNTPVAGRKVSPEQHDKLLYIAISRAKYALYVIGSKEMLSPRCAG